MKKNNIYTIQTIVRVSIVLVLLFVFLNVNAQPAKQYYGCKNSHHHHLSKAPELTPEELAKVAFSNERSDTIDIIHYNISLDFTQFNQQEISGSNEISIQSKMSNVNSITLDLLDLNIDSITALNTLLNYAYDGNLLTIEFSDALDVDEELTFTVFYNGHPTPAASGFGGLVWQSGIAYNLGIGLGATPYNYGRGWFPCFDTFVERSTYEFNIISNAGKRAYCVGTFMGEDILPNGDLLRSYEMNQQLPTYLAGIAVGDYDSWNATHTGAFGDVELELLAKPNDLSTVVNSFQYLDESVDNLEYWWGEYPWERVGYVMTGNGAMEHPTNVAYPISLADDGPVPVHNEVMAHELGHHWWGNVVTLNGPQNMWIKEGPAEYSSHLFYEYVFGRDEFLTVTKNNLLLVMEEAHINDNGYQALSPMPYEQTYGTHTYQKGALVIHNLRGYLGDSLFRVGMQSVLAEFAYGHMDAIQFRDHLTIATGVDMEPYFDAWIFAPGYSSYEIDKMSSTASGNNFDVELEVQQKLHAATIFHQQTPLAVTFMDENFNVHHDQIMTDGEFSTVTISVPFEPSTVFLNGDHQLNLAVIGDQKMLNDDGPTGIVYGGIGANIQSNVDSSFIRIEEYRVAADFSPTNIYDARIATGRYFRVAGVLNPDTEIRGSLSYDGSDPEKLDYDLVNITEDSLVVLYRANPEDDWSEYDDYEVKVLGSSTNGTGFIFIENMQLGEYTLANADIPMVSSDNIIKEKINWTLFPNPTSDQIKLHGALSKDGTYKVSIYDIRGNIVLGEEMEVVNEKFSLTVDLQKLSNGIYVAVIRGENGKEWGSQTIEILE
jgi:hypothetical protein